MAGAVRAMGGRAPERCVRVPLDTAGRFPRRRPVVGQHGAMAPPSDGTPRTPKSGAPHRARRRGRSFLGWVIVVCLCLVVILSLVPDALGPLNGSLRLSQRIPFSQVIALRSPLAFGFAVLGLVVGAAALVRRARRTGGRRMAVLAVVLLLVAGAHTGALAHRGLDSGQVVTAADPAVIDSAAWDGTVRILTFNTLQGRADRSRLAADIDDAGAQVVVLPETGADEGRELADLLSRDGLPYAVHSSASGGGRSAGEEAAGDSGAAESEGTDDAVAPTTVLISPILGEYEEDRPVDDIGHGAVLLRPAGDVTTPAGYVRPTLLGVHTIAPLPGTMEDWSRTVTAAARQCAPETLVPGTIVAGDFNATLDHAPLKDLGGCADAGTQSGIGGLATWPTASRTDLLGATLDHILIDESVWTASAGRVLSISGSDHRGVLVELRQAQ